jgi:hypothetical protein
MHVAVASLKRLAVTTSLETFCDEHCHRPPGGYATVAVGGECVVPEILEAWMRAGFLTNSR